MHENDTSSFILSLSNNEICSANGDYILGYKINYPSKHTQTKEDFEELNKCWVDVCTHLPTGTIVLKSDLYELKEYDSSSMQGGEFLDVAMAKHFEDRKYIEHIGFIFFIEPSKQQFSKSIQNPFNLIKLDDNSSDREEFNNAVAEAAALFPKSHKLEVMTEVEFDNYQKFYFNGLQKSHYTDSTINKDSIEVDDKQLGVFAIVNEQSLPDETSVYKKDKGYSSLDNEYICGYMDDFGTELRCSHILNQIIIIDSHQSHINNINTTISNLKHAELISPANKMNKELLSEVIEEDTKSSSLKFVRGSISLIFAGNTPSEFKRIKSNISAIFKSNDINVTYARGARLQDIYLNSFVTNVSNLSSFNLYIVNLPTAISLFVLNTTYKDDKEGVILMDRDNTPTVYDFWDTSHIRKNERNFAIIAEPGSGKSVVCQYLFYQLLTRQNVKNIIIDVGKSYERYAQTFDKERVHIINFKADTPIGINPFRLYANDTDKLGKIESIEQFVWGIVKRNDNPITGEESTSMRNIINRFYQSVTETSKHNFEAFYNYIDNNKDTIHKKAGIENEEYFNVSEFLHNGGEFSGSGTYAPMIRDIAGAEEDIISAIEKKDLVFIELDEIKDNPLILNIAIMAIKDTIRRVVWKDRLTKAIVVFEEFAKLLEISKIRKSVEYYMQTARKYHGSIGLVLQNVNQLTFETQGTIDNIGTFVFLKGTKIESTRQKLNLSDHVVTQLKSLSNNFGNEGDYKYSEVLFYNNNSICQPYRIELPYEMFLTFQTEGDLYEIINALYERYGTIKAAVDTYIKMEKRNPHIREEINNSFIKEKAINPLCTINDILTLKLL